MKKVVKILSILILLCVAFIIIVPIIFEGKIIQLVKKTANNNINAITEITSQTELGAKETSEASRDLAKIATQLHVLVSQFKLG